MAREKKPVHKVQMTEGKRNIIHQLLEEYDIQSAEDIQELLQRSWWNHQRDDGSGNGWPTTWDMKNQNVLIAMIIAMVI